MLTRREILIGAGMAGVAALTDRVTTAFATASQPSTPVSFHVPKGACDSHTHILDPQRFPYAPGRGYSPEAASVPEMRALHKALHTERVVVVQPSSYAADNTCLLDALKQLGPSSRGVAVINDKTTNEDLDQMHRAGVRGLRVTLVMPGLSAADARQHVKENLDRIKDRKDWHLGLYAPPTIIAAIREDVEASPVPFSFDHFGGAQGALGVNQPGLDALMGLLHSGKAYVKVSAPYRSSSQKPDYADLDPIAKAFIAANPERVIWGTDWPHPQQVPGRKPEEVSELFQIDDGRDLNRVAIWAPDAGQRKLILVDNPARLYRF
jgi:predicted TIM-barrel fold metal-dependent hydrolase